MPTEEIQCSMNLFLYFQSGLVILLCIGDGSGFQTNSSLSYLGKADISINPFSTPLASLRIEISVEPRHEVGAKRYQEINFRKENAQRFQNPFTENMHME